MIDLATISLSAVIAAGVVFLIAGCVKGVVGLGLPTVSLGLLTFVVDLPTAMALLVAPAFVTNVWQSVAGGGAMAVLRRIWPFLALAFATVWIGSEALSRVDMRALSVLLGVLLIVYGATGLAGWRPRISARSEWWVGPAFGATNGVLTGMTGSFVVPGVLFLQAIGLPRDQLVQAMGMLFTLSTVALAGALWGQGAIDAEIGLASLAATAPALLGVAAGARIRRRISEAAFRRALFAAILGLGAAVALNALA